jgi:hypothetical protein
LRRRVTGRLVNSKLSRSRLVDVDAEELEYTGLPGREVQKLSEILDVERLSGR